MSVTEENTIHEHSGGSQIVFFVFMGLLLGAFLKQVNKITKIPYTPMLLVMGIFLGYFRGYLGVFGSSVDKVQVMNPHLILLIFIPVLIFESAYNCDWYIFRKSLKNILLLAGPGVLWGAVLIALIFKVLLMYTELTWAEALTLGSVLSATDPVAVVALLKDLGANPNFNTLVEGESLLNDGTAMVFFSLFLGLIKGEQTSSLSVFTNFLRVSCGGPILGLIIGFISCWWLKKIIRDSVLSVNITFIAAFLCFYFAQFTWLKVSGILSIVVLGLYFSAVGKRKIYPQSEHALHNVWASVQYASETLIFVLTGILVGVKMIQQTTITTSDWLRMFLFWILMIFARAIMILTFYPFLKQSGYGLTKKQLIVLIYGGLRGALGMCLSLIVYVDHDISIRFRELTVFYMCGMAMLTIVVNGLTCSTLVNYIEMVSVPKIKLVLLSKCIKEVLDFTQKKFQELKSDSNLSYAKWSEVKRMTKLKELGQSCRDERNRIDIRESLIDFNQDVIVEEVRFLVTRYLKKTYWEFFEEGQLSEESVQVLTESCDIAKDQVKEKSHYFSLLSSYFALGDMQLFMKFRDTLFIGKFFSRAIIQKIYFAYEISLVFVEACEEVELHFKNNFPTRKQHLNYVLQEIKEDSENAVAYLNELENNFPDVIQVVQTQRATSILLKSKRHQLTRLYNQGFVDQKDYSILRHQVDTALLRLRQQNITIENFKIGEGLSHCPLLSTLTRTQLTTLRMNYQQKSYQKNSILLEKNKKLDYVSIIIVGAVKEKFDEFYLIRSIGNFINPYDYQYKSNSKCEARCQNNVKVLEIKLKEIEDLMDKNQEFKKGWYKSLLLYCVHHQPNLRFLKTKFTNKQLRRYLQKSEIHVLKANTTRAINEGVYVLSGEIQQKNKILFQAEFQEDAQIIKAKTDAVIVNFKKIPGTKIDERKSILSNQ